MKFQSQNSQKNELQKRMGIPSAFEKTDGTRLHPSAFESGWYAHPLTSLINGMHRWYKFGKPSPICFQVITSTSICHVMSF